MRILAIEPDNETLKAIEIMLGAERFNVYGADMGEEGFELAKLYDYDAITLELDLSDLSGFDIIRRLRDCRVRTPILVLTKAASIEDKVRALDLGADDYMVKPFHRDELASRLSAIVRRSKGVTQRIITIGEVSLDLNRQLVTVCGAPAHLTNSEYKILRTLMLSAGNVMAKERILNALYGGMDEPDAKIIDVFVCKLRKKLVALGTTEDFVQTIWGRGYMVEKYDHAAVGSEVAVAIQDGLHRYGRTSTQPPMLSERGIKDLVG